MPKFSSLLPRRIVTACVLVTLAVNPASLAASLNWKSAADGLASDSRRWNPNGVPTKDDIVSFTLAGSYTVTWDRDVPATRVQVYDAGTVTIHGTSKHTVNDLFIVGDGSHADGKAAIDAGVWTMASQFMIGEQDDNRGDLDILGEKTFVRCNGDAGLVTVGGSGDGTLDVLGGATFESPHGMILANASTATATVRVNGAGSNDGFPATIKVVGDADAKLIVGLDGDASLHVFDGALLQAPKVIIGQNKASNSQLRIGGGGDSASMEVDSCDVGDSQSGSTAGGTAVLDAFDATASITVAHALRVGDSRGGDATLKIRQGGQVQCESVDLKFGKLEFSGGKLKVVAGKFIPPNVSTFELNGDGTSYSIMQLIDGADSTFNVPITLGTTDQGSLACLSGASLIENLGTGEALTLGRDFGSIGTLYSIDAGSSISIGDASAELIIGSGGSGVVGVIDGGTMTVPTIQGGLGDGSYCRVTVDAGALQIGNTFSIGRDDGKSLGLFEMYNGATAEVLGTDTSELKRHCTLHIEDSELVMSGQLDIRDTLEMINGRIVTPHLSIFPGFASLTGVVEGPLVLKTAKLVVANGNLTAGDPTSSIGFHAYSNSQIEVTSGELTVLDSDHARFGNTVLNNATINAANGMDLLSGTVLSLTGDDTIHGDLFNEGSLSFGGAVLHMNGNLSDDGEGVTGGSLVLGANGSYTGDGVMNVSQFVTEAGSHVTPSGDLTIGKVGMNFTIFDGDLNVGLNDVALRDTDGVKFTGNVTLAGGTLSSKSKIDQGPTATFSGRGTLLSETWQCAGTISPGGDEIGELGLGGSLTLLDGAVIVIDLVDTDPNEFDVLFISNTAQFNDVGTLRVRFLEYVPQAGDKFDVIGFDARTGKIANFEYDTVNALRPILKYSNTKATLEFAATGDTNCDGAMDFNDIDSFVQMLADPEGYANAFPNCGLATGDINGDGVTDFNDIDGFVDCLVSGGC